MEKIVKDGNIIAPYKGRAIRHERPVWVYRNLRGDSAHKYSLRQGGLVVAHATRVMLTDVRFVINKAGQKRVRLEKRKNVHAFVVGRVSLKGAMGTTAADTFQVKVVYNPYEMDGFHGILAGIDKPFPVGSAMAAIINEKGVSACYTSRLDN